MERKETRATVRACIERLPDSYRTVLMEWTDAIISDGSARAGRKQPVAKV
jgi:hypothetical protein